MSSRPIHHITRYSIFFWWRTMTTTQCIVYCSSFFQFGGWAGLSFMSLKGSIVRRVAKMASFGVLKTALYATKDLYPSSKSRRYHSPTNTGVFPRDGISGRQLFRSLTTLLSFHKILIINIARLTPQGINYLTCYESITASNITMSSPKRTASSPDSVATRRSSRSASARAVSAPPPTPSRRRSNPPTSPTAERVQSPRKRSHPSLSPTSERSQPSRKSSRSTRSASAQSQSSKRQRTEALEPTSPRVSKKSKPPPIATLFQAREHPSTNTNPPPFNEAWGLIPTIPDGGPVARTDQPPARSSNAQTVPPLWEDRKQRFQIGNRFIQKDISSSSRDLDQEELLQLKLIDLRETSKHNKAPRRKPVFYEWNPEKGAPIDWNNKQAIKALNDRRQQAISRITRDRDWTEEERAELADIFAQSPDISILEATERFNWWMLGTDEAWLEDNMLRTVESVRYEYLSHQESYDAGGKPKTRKKGTKKRKLEEVDDSSDGGDDDDDGQPAPKKSKKTADKPTAKKTGKTAAKGAKKATRAVVQLSPSPPPPPAGSRKGRTVPRHTSGLNIDMGRHLEDVYYDVNITLALQGLVQSTIGNSRRSVRNLERTINDIYYDPDLMFRLTQGELELALVVREPTAQPAPTTSGPAQATEAEGQEDDWESTDEEEEDPAE
ncbi:unnamed protein product [Periconia digitata]|uniref:Myb-like domain-containing protein n=1 Tax=Periconia digitata TaxID=1303443 RepID=A0A9W4XJF8_9PLEO|nr:unnamed protein product [Periconia digitata]